MNTLQSHTWRDKRLYALLIILSFISISMALSAKTCMMLTSIDIIKSQQYQIQLPNNQTNSGKIILTFTDIRSASGNILVALYTKEEQWTDQPYKQLKFSKENMVDGCFTVKIDSLPQQNYAIAVMDDENADFKMQYFCGLPTEGFGMSSNPSFFKLKKPKFNEVSFVLDAAIVRTSIKLNYLNPNRKIK